MHKHWLLGTVTVIVAVIITACGGGDGDGDSDSPADNPGGLTSDQVGVQVSGLLTALGCDVPARYSRISAADGDVWSLRANMGVTTFTWTFDPANDSVVEREGRCKIPKPTPIPVRDPDDSRYFDSEQVEVRVKELLTAQGCTVPENFGFVNRIGDSWTLRADIGPVPFLWFYDAVANTLTEHNGLCDAEVIGS